MYVEQLLEQIADEVNVKQVILKAGDLESIYHYDDWGTLNNMVPRKGFEGDWKLASLWFSGDILEDMSKVREVVKEGLNQRAKAKIRVRQPLQAITLSGGLYE